MTDKERRDSPLLNMSMGYLNPSRVEFCRSDYVIFRLSFSPERGQGQVANIWPDDTFGVLILIIL